MRQNVGLSAFIIATLAFLARTGSPGPQAGQPALQKKAEPKAPAADQNAPSEEILEGPWLATRPFFHSTDNPREPMLVTGSVDFKTPSSIRNCATEPAGICRPQLVHYFGIPDTNKIQFLIATVPDPLHSRLSLFTDSSIQAIEDAAQASDWIFASEWLPWVDSADPDEKDPEKRRLERQDIRHQEVQPGILVFHRSAHYKMAHLSDTLTTANDDPLVVFLVGDTPTSGVNSPQFELARAYMRAIREPSDEIRILGPTFSGSFESLGRLLADDRNQGVPRAYRVRSGTVTSTEDEAFFQRPGVDFKGATANSDDQQTYFGSALNDLRIDHAHAALLVEDESAYGHAALTASQNVAKDIRILHFPRDISHLRNAYRDAVSASKGGNSPPPEIEFSLKDPETGEDSIPVFSGSQSPLSQNGVVNTIAKAIRGADIRLVRVEATNVLDELFLANVLKRQCPDTRLMLNQPDVLLIQAAQTEPLSGTLVLASYPMFFASNAWMGGLQANRPVTFPDANSEGVYNATVLLLNETDAEAARSLADYHWRELHHPPTWLLALDRQGFVPVDVFPHPSNFERDEEKWFQKVDPSHPPLPSLPEPPWMWNFVSAAVALASLALSFWIWWISLDQFSERDDRLSFLQIDSEGGWRRFHIFALLIVLLLAEITMGLPVLRAEPPWGFVALLAFSWIMAFATAWRVLQSAKADRDSTRAMWCILASAAVFFALWGTASLWPHSLWPHNDRSFFFAFRARELRFGSSPIWPVITSLSALALLAFVHLTRYYLAACQKPDIIAEGLRTALEARLAQAWKDFNAALDMPRGPRFAIREKRWKPLIILALCVGAISALFRIDVQMWSIDGLSYNLLALLLQFFVIILLLLTCRQIRFLWHSLQSFLASLGMLPLASSFKPVDQSGADRPIWVRRLNLQSIDTHIQAVYVLHNMTILAKEVPALDAGRSEYLAGLKKDSDDYTACITKLLEVSPQRPRHETLNLTKAMRSSNKLIATKTFSFLHAYWSETQLAAPKAPARPDDGKTDAAEPLAAPTTPLDRLADLAQRFVALHYSSYILYGVRQIQNLLLFLSSGFVLLMISLNCYTVQAPQFVQKLLLLLFLIVGTAIVSCLAGLERDPVLSRMAGSDPGKLNTGFYLKILAYGALPALGLLASEFPSISNFLLSWVEPTLEAFK